MRGEISSGKHAKRHPLDWYVDETWCARQLAIVLDDFAIEREDGRGPGLDWGELVPRLQRFYGGRPQDWLEAVPAALVRACVRMMPRIEAAETLAAVNRAALTNNVGFQNDIDRQRALEQLEQRVRGVVPGEEPARRASADDLAGMGIGIVTEEPADG